MSDASTTLIMGRFDASPGPGPLRTEYQRLVRSALRRGDNQPEEMLKEPLIGDYHPSVIKAGINSWRERSLHEHHSAAVFSRLLPQFIAAGASLDYKAVTLRASMDELRHASLCAGIVRLLGGDPIMEADLHTAPLPEHSDATPKEAALRNVLFASCLSETVSVALLSEERDLAKEPAIVSVLKQLSADEILHAKMGWSYLTETLPELGDRGPERIAGYLPTAFGYLEKKMLAAMPVKTPPPAELQSQADALGLMNGRDGREILYATIEHVIIPRFESLGIAAGRAWASRVKN